MTANIVSIRDPDILDIIGESFYHKLVEDIEMLDNLVPPADLDKIQVSCEAF